jgi:hypothetical protein
MKLLAATIIACLVAVIFTVSSTKKSHVDDDTDDSNTVVHTAAIGFFSFVVVYITYDMFVGTNTVVEMLRHIETGEPGF